MEKSEYRRARRSLIQRKNFPCALQLSQDWIAHNPDDAYGYFEVAWTHMALGNLTEALNWINKALANDERQVKFLMFKANVLSKCGKSKDADIIRSELTHIISKNKKQFVRETKEKREEISARVISLLNPLGQEDCDGRLRTAIKQLLEHLYIDLHPKWAEFVPRQTEDGQVALVRGVGHFLITNMNDVIQKRLSRGMPWEPHLLALIAGLSHLYGRQFWAIEVGANIGALSVPLTRLCNGPVYLFEPNRTSRRILNKNLAMNSATNAFVSPFALGAKRCVAALSRQIENNLGATAYHVIEDENSILPTDDTVSVESLNTYTHIFPRQSVCVLKIDVEGMETDVLLGADIFIKTHRPFIIIEAWNSNIERVTKLLKNVGYCGSVIFRDDYFFRPIRLVHPGKIEH